MLELPSSMTWVLKASAPYESDWMAMHRFLWMNAINGEDLWRVLTGIKKLPISKNFAEKYIELIKNSSATSEFFKHFQARSLINCFGQSSGSEMLKVKNIRYCPLCLNECFHSPIFQISSVKKCPFHECNLIDACEHCGKSVGAPKFSPEWFYEPLACRFCHKSFCKTKLAYKALIGFEEGEKEFRKIEELISKIRSVQFLRINKFSEDSRISCDYKTICDCIVNLAIPQSNNESWIDAKFPCTISDVINENDSYTKNSFARKNRFVPLNQDLNAACVIAKSINRYLSKRLNLICGHRRTGHLSWDNDPRPFMPVQPILTMFQGDCPCCAILDQWRAYAGKLIALRNIVRKYRIPMYEFYLRDLRTTFTLEPKLCAEALISSFTWFANSMTNILMEYEGLEEKLWYEKEEGRSKSLPSHHVLSLDVYRFDIRPHWYVFKVQGVEVGLSYSLRHAFDSLRECQTIYEKGGYWSANGKREHYLISRIKNDHWYIAMSVYLHTRQNAHFFAHTPMQIREVDF